MRLSSKNRAMAMDEATRQIITDAVAVAVEGAYKRLKENGLNDLSDRIDALGGRIDDFNTRLGSVEQATTRVESIVGEIPVMNQNINTIRDNLGM